MGAIGSLYRTTGVRGLWRGLTVIVHCTLFITHSSSAQSITGAWVGVKQELDSGFVCPLPLYLDVRADSTYTLSLIDNAARNPRATWAMNGQRLRLDTLLFEPKQVRLTDTELSLTGTTPLLFRRVQPAGSPGQNEASVRALLTNRIWQKGAARYHFHNGGQACLETAQNGDRAIRCWSVVERDGAVFIIVKGNRTDCSRNYDAPMLVEKMSGNILTVNEFVDRSTGSTLTALGALPAGKPCGAAGFQLCTTCFYAPGEQANSLDKKGPAGRFYAIRQRLQATYVPGERTGPTGVVQVRCIVNCEGQAGRFSAKTYGPDYQLLPNNQPTTNQLVTILQTYFATGWQPGRVRAIPRPLDYVATINIRLVDGHITDVFP